MSTIEPTEEQRAAAVRHHYKYAVLPVRGYLTDWVRTGDATGREDVFAVVISLARLLAEREAKLRRDLTKQCDPTVDMCGGCSACVHWLRDRNLKLDADIDTMRARVAELERPNWLTTPTRSTRSRKDRLKEARERETALTKRVAELEAKIADAVFSCPGCGRDVYGDMTSEQIVDRLTKGDV